VDGVVTPILKIWPSTIGFLPVWFSESLFAWTSSHIAWATAECHSVTAADEWDNFYWAAGICAVVQRWKRTLLTRMETILKWFWAVFYWSLVKFLHMCSVNSVKQQIGSSTLWLPLMRNSLYCLLHIKYAQICCYNLSNRSAGRVQIMKFY
jgi:hypothetical protein